MKKSTFDNDSWNTGDEVKCAKECSWADAYEGGNIYITPDLKRVIEKLCTEIVSEWQMLLTGTETDKGVYCTGYVIPKQEVTFSTVKNLDCINKEFIEQNNVVCTIHSHSSMGVFFSSTDDEYTNMSLITNHIVCNNHGLFKAIRRFDLPCKMTKFFDAKVIVQYQDNDVEVEGMDNIQTKKYEHVGFGHGVVGGGRGLGWYGGENYPAHIISDAEPKPLFYGKRNKKRRKAKNKKKNNGSTLHIT